MGKDAHVASPAQEQNRQHAACTGQQHRMVDNENRGKTYPTQRQGAFTQAQVTVQKCVGACRPYARGINAKPETEEGASSPTASLYVRARTECQHARVCREQPPPAAVKMQK